jgi:exodeoxyribonuclease V beta subunit
LPEEQLPGGAQSGLFLHHLLEHMPFDSAAGPVDFDDWRRQPEIARMFRNAALRYNRDLRYLPYSQHVIFQCLKTPIGVGRKVVPELASCERILREVEFAYPIPTDQARRAALGLLAESGSIRLERGYVKGFIDLVFEFQGRVYLVDWKSDILPDYGSKSMARHVFHEYQVQAELYSLALARMLELASDAHHKRRFGGLLYCFMRGMSAAPGSEGRQPGVYYIRPNFARLCELERALEERDDYR